MGDIGARMTVIRIPDRTLMLHSPVELDAALKNALDGLGSVRWILGNSPVTSHEEAIKASSSPA